MRIKPSALLSLVLLLPGVQALGQEVPTGEQQRLLELKKMEFARQNDRLYASVVEAYQKAAKFDVDKLKMQLEQAKLDGAVWARVPSLDSLDAGFPSGAWWRNPEFAKAVELSAEQQKRMEDVFAQHRLRLIELNAGLVKEEAVLRPLLADVRPDEESRILDQIDRVAQARADLEKTNARMLLGLRQVLSQDQWTRLSSLNGVSLTKKTLPTLPALRK